MEAPLKDNRFCGYHLVVTRVEWMDALVKSFEKTSNDSYRKTLALIEGEGDRKMHTYRS